MKIAGTEQEWVACTMWKAAQKVAFDTSFSPHRHTHTAIKPTLYISFIVKWKIS